MEWVRQNLASDSKIFFNFRDYPDAIVNEPKRVLKVIKYLSSLPPKQRPFGFVFEEPTGNYFPDQLGAWTAAVRGKWMNVVSKMGSCWFIFMRSGDWLK